MELDRGTIDRWLRSNLPEALEKLGGLTLEALQKSGSLAMSAATRRARDYPFSPNGSPCGR
jgi:hypothetical protein